MVVEGGGEGGIPGDYVGVAGEGGSHLELLGVRRTGEVRCLGLRGEERDVVE